MSHNKDEAERSWQTAWKYSWWSTVKLCGACGLCGHLVGWWNTSHMENWNRMEMWMENYYFFEPTSLLMLYCCLMSKKIIMNLCICVKRQTGFTFCSNWMVKIKIYFLIASSYELLITVEFTVDLCKTGLWWISLLWSNMQKKNLRENSSLAVAIYNSYTAQVKHFIQFVHFCFQLNFH